MNKYTQRKINILLAERIKLEQVKADSNFGASHHNCVDLELKRIENTLQALGYNKD